MQGHNDGQQSQRGPQTPVSQRTVSQMQVAIPGHNYNGQTVSGRPFQMQEALPGDQFEQPQRSVYLGLPSRMQVGARSQRSEDYPSPTVASRSSSAQVGSLTQRYGDASRSTVSGLPSRMQVAAPSQRDVSYGAPSTRQSQQQVGSTSQHGQQSRRGTVNNYINIQMPPSALPSINESQPSSYGASYRRPQSTRTQAPSGAQPTFIAASDPPRTFLASRPTVGRTQMIRPGEPHHFGSSTDPISGAILCSLCRCSDPHSHGDAYTMLASPRGYDIKGYPISWQEAKRRMLDLYGLDQIDHQMELGAMPHVYDARTTKAALRQERELEDKVRSGESVRVNVEGNETSWHNEDGHAKRWVTEEGAKTVLRR